MGNVVTFNRNVLDQYLAMTNSILLMAFDFTRTDPRGFGGWHDVGQEEKVAENDFFYRSHIESGQASYTRGVQIVRSRISKEALVTMHDHPDAEYGSMYPSLHGTSKIKHYDRFRLHQTR